ncbi:MAG: hypothetical protein RH942_01550 [Kiloniellaceae bacterium]
MSANTTKTFDIPVWLQPDGAPLSCREKIKVLNENLEEIREMAQDALEDGILMGCDESQLREVLMTLVDSLENPYETGGGAAASGKDDES